MILFMLITVAVALTCAMFATKQMMLGFPSVIFWAIAGGQAYMISTALWDIYYFIAIACLLGMTIYCSLAMYGLRDRKPTLGEIEDGSKFVDEGKDTALQIGKFEEVGEAKSKDNDGMFDTDSESTPSEREKQIKQRASDRNQHKRIQMRIDR